MVFHSKSRFHKPQAGLPFNNLREVLLLVLIVAGWISGCAPETTEARVGLNQPFEMKIEQEVRITGEDLNIEFVDITEDSRCPQGVVCVWAGQVSAWIQMSTGEGQEDVILTESAGGPGKATYREYRLEFGITPYPDAGKPIAKEDYRLMLTISK